MKFGPAAAMRTERSRSNSSVPNLDEIKESKGCMIC